MFMLLAGSASQAPAQEAGYDLHHPAAGAGGPAPELSPEFGAMAETRPRSEQRRRDVSRHGVHDAGHDEVQVRHMMGEGAGGIRVEPQGAGMPTASLTDPVTGAF